MPGIALRMAASITVAPFSTSMVRVSPVWSTKWILAMVLVLPVEGRQSYNGSIRFAPAFGLKSCVWLQWPDQDRLRMASIAARASVRLSLRAAKAAATSVLLFIAVSSRAAASPTPNAPIARADPFGVCVRAAALGGHV